MTRMPLPCDVPGCWRLSAKAGRCSAHYMQERRAIAAGERVQFTEPRTPPGEAGGRIQLRPTRELRAAIDRAAKRDGKTVAEWVIATLARVLGVGE